MPADIELEIERAKQDAINRLRGTIHSREFSAVRSLQAVNAGGVVALLAFLAQTWGVAPELRWALVLAIAAMLVGLLAAVGVGFLMPDRAEWTFRQSESERAADRHLDTEGRYRLGISISFSAFVLAVVILLGRVIATIV